MNPETRRLQDEAVAAAADGVLVPHPGGASGRATAEHDAALDAVAVGDVNAACGHEIAAKALTDAALAERPSEPTTRTAI